MVHNKNKILDNSNIFNNDELLLLNKNDPDYHIEYFWIGFKKSMINFYISIKKNYDHINIWSNILNQLKCEKKYDTIESNIRDYMAHYALDIIKNCSDSIYNDDILITNIRRWNKISNQFNFEKSQNHNKIILIFMIFVELKKDNSYIIIELDIIENNNFDKIIEYSLNNNKTKILEILKQIPDYNLFFNINKLFPKLNLDNVIIKIHKLCLLYKKIYIK